MPSDRIKVGLLIDSFFVPAWIYETLKRIIETNYATISLVVKMQIEKPKKNPSKNFHYLAYNLYRKIENKFIKLKYDAFFSINIIDLINDVPLLKVQSYKKESFEYLEENDIQLINSYGLDVCIKLSSENLIGAIFSCAKFGVWAYEQGKHFVYTGTSAGVWEVIEEVCETEIALKMLSKDAEEGNILYQSFSSTNVAINKNQNIACWKAVSFIPRKLKELYETKGEDFLENVKKKNQDIEFNNKRQNTPPKNARFVTFLFKRYFKWTKKKIWNFFNLEQWLLLYNFNKINEFPEFPLSAYHEIIPTKDRFWADPCIFSTDDEKYFIFFEEYIYKKKKAHISVTELDKRGKISQPKIVLEKPYHLSYPFVFNEGTDIYMIPETSENKTIEIYKCISFPYKWAFQMNLMENIHAVDATIHYQDNMFWLFVNIIENNGASAWDELFLFYSDKLLTTNWQPHPQNPVISDVRSARPAGRIFTHEGKLYRPSQDSSCTYGYATNMNEVLVLNATEYSERKVTTLFPKWNKKVTAVHTFSFNDALAVIDARFKRRK
ncbi:MAG TPA: hypothetical protein VN958_18750 [Chitinophagaceae bacterium]|nr:hypothetical protein [Chitinophagaceae bacterium]